MAWALLIGAGLLEIVWATALKYTDGFTRLWPSVLGVAGAAEGALPDATSATSLSPDDNARGWLQ